ATCAAAGRAEDTAIAASRTMRTRVIMCGSFARKLRHNLAKRRGGNQPRSDTVPTAATETAINWIGPLRREESASGDIYVQLVLRYVSENGGYSSTINRTYASTRSNHLRTPMP